MEYKLVNKWRYHFKNATLADMDDEIERLFHSQKNNEILIGYSIAIQAQLAEMKLGSYQEDWKGFKELNKDILKKLKMFIKTYHF